MVYVISAFLFGTACAAAVLFAADRALKKGNPSATESTPSPGGAFLVPRRSLE